MESAGFSAIEPTTLGEEAYQQIASALRGGTLQPGDRLKIRELSQRLSISSTPVRDALRRLLHEGALEQRSPRDIRVPFITRDRYREVVMIRMELEGLAAARAAELHDDDALERLWSNIRLSEIAISNERWAEASSLNEQFHFALVEIARMPIMHGVLRSLWLQVGPAVSAFYNKGRKSMLFFHYEVVDAITRKDQDSARKAIQLDIGNAVETILPHLIENAPCNVGGAYAFGPPSTSQNAARSQGL